MKTNIVIYSNQLTKEDIKVLLQAIRDAEQLSFKDKEIGIFVSAPELSTQEMEEIISSVEPGFIRLHAFPRAAI